MPNISTRLSFISLAVVALLTCACTDRKTEVVEVKPATASLSRTLDMVDKDGRHYGTVEMSPLGGGKVIDSDGHVVGLIVPPDDK